MFLFSMRARVCFILLFATATLSSLHAQTYSPVAVSGFNVDAIAETPPDALGSTSQALDLSNYVMYSQTFGSGAGLTAGIVDNGTIVSGTRTYQLQPFSQDNLLYVPIGNTETLTLLTPASYAQLSLLAFCTEGSGTLNITVNFTDGSSTNFNNVALQDWFNGTGNVYCCFGRCARINPVTNATGLPSNPRFYPVDLSLTCSDAQKHLQSITVNTISGSSGFTRACVMAVSGSANSQNITATVTNATCNNASNGSVVLNISGGAAPYSYLWNTGVTSISISSVPPGTYVVTVTDANNCSMHDTVVVGVTAGGSTALATALPDTVCTGGSTQLSITGLTSFTWHPGLQTTSPVTVTPSSTTTYTVTGINTNGCADTATIAVVANIPLAVNITPSSPAICFGDSVALHASGGVSYAWTPAAGLSSYNVSSPFAFPSSSVWYHVVATAGNGCQGSDSVHVIVTPLPQPSVTPSPAAMCVGDNLTLSASGGVSYAWSPSTYLNNASASNPVTSATSSITYHVTVIGAGGCHAFDSVHVTVNPAPVASVVPASDSICRGDSVLLLASGGLTYAWSPAAGLSSASVNNPVARPTTTVNYVMTVTDANGCTARDTARIVVSAATNAYAGTSTSICRGLTAHLAATGGISYLWQPSVGLNDSTSSHPLASPTQTTTYTATILSANGCSVSFPVTINVYSDASIDAGPSGSVCPYHPTQLYANGGDYYSWSPAAQLSCQQCGEPIATPAGTTTYDVTITDLHGCVYLRQVVLTEDSACLDAYVPNAFSPNGDGFNDLLKPIGAMRELTFMVYNRWGNLEFETHELNKGWDGMHNGKPSPMDVYVWSLDAILVNGRHTVKKGNVVLMR